MLAAFPLGRGWGVLGWLIAVAALLLVAGLASVWRARGYSRRARVVWTVLVIALPIIGPLAWFVAGRERHHAPPYPHG